MLTFFFQARAENKSSRKINMALAQVYLLTKNVNGACKVLEEMDIAQKPGIVCLKKFL